jgi:hypothetical protein
MKNLLASVMLAATLALPAIAQDAPPPPEVEAGGT